MLYETVPMSMVPKLEKFTAITADNNGNRTDWNWPYLRYADLILIYCEAENELNGPTTDAFAKMEMLNKRNNSTLVSKRHEKNPFTKESFRSFVLEERAKEFAAEGYPPLWICSLGYLSASNECHRYCG